MAQPGGRAEGPYSSPPPQQRPQTNGMAVASLVLGILWLCSLGSIAAIILGHAALHQINRSGAAGRGIAIAGLVLGYVGLAITVAAVAFSYGVVGRWQPDGPRRPPNSLGVHAATPLSPLAPSAASPLPGSSSASSDVLP